jgi:hypothetical protein
VTATPAFAASGVVVLGAATTHAAPIGPGGEEASLAASPVGPASFEDGASGEPESPGFTLVSPHPKNAISAKRPARTPSMYHCKRSSAARMRGGIGVGLRASRVTKT